jgi:hypothetical protein
MAPTSGPPAPVRSWTCRQHTAREPAIAAEYYGADTENGDRMDDPSEDGLFKLLSELNPASNTFVTIIPADDSRVPSLSAFWFWVPTFRAE